MPEFNPASDEVFSPLMPVRLGSALRVPSYAYSNWGIPEGEFRERSDDAYRMEWEGGSPRQMKYVIEATEAAGLQNFPQILRNANAAAVSKLVQEMMGTVNYLECGAGVSTVNVYEKLLADNIDIERVYATLIEPSQERLDKMTADLEELGLKKDKDFTTHAARDIDARDFTPRGSQDIVSAVAAIHHHAYLDTPFRVLYHVTKHGGSVLLPDWHNSMWEHPHRVFEFLKRFDWETKHSDLDDFARAYPKALESPGRVGSSAEFEANATIRNFWGGWADVRRKAQEAGEFRPEDDILLLEGHRPALQYARELFEVGFNHVTSERLLSGNDLLYMTTAKK